MKGSDLMFCSHCGKQLDDGTKFCIFCGNATTAAPAPVEDPIPQNGAPVPPSYAPPVYTDPKPPVQPKKKGGKKGLIIAIILVLVLAIGGGAGFYFYTQHVYEQNMAAYNAAEAMLKKGNYDGALSAFLELGDFEDAADRADELQELQEAYDDALAMLANNDFDGAREAFRELGDYRDSKNYVDNEVRYQQALYLMEVAAPDTGAKAANYLDAAAIFSELGSYTNAASMASDCYLEYGMLMLQIDSSAALAYTDFMDADDVTALQDAYAELFADGAFLQDLKAAILTWYDDSNSFTYAAELEEAYAMVDGYHDADFMDTQLYDWLENFQYGLELMYASLSDEDSVDVWSGYYLGEYYVFAVADLMYENYGIFADDPESVERFTGVAELYYAYANLEYSMENWWENTDSLVQLSDGHWYLEYTNDTDYSFNLHATVYFYDSADNLLEVGDEQVIYVAKGATIYIPAIPATISDNAWQTCNLFWDFSSVS